MIALLRGKVALIREEELVLDVHGVGYRVEVPTGLGGRLPQDEEVTLHIATVIREDAFLLYGFSTVEERDAFGTLREVSGVGPKMALAAIGALGLAELAAAIERDDLRALCRIPGVGKKTASRMALELKGKLPQRFVAAGVQGGAHISRSAPDDPLPLALNQLGYRKSEIDRAMGAEEVPRLGEAPVEARLQAALRLFARREGG